ncbi:hypothetical protein A1O1_04248 [Capronia coronata CBS 617.96]|uniref:Alcohol acetyltransferase n=1 Tax=Capronia coronata CBS 617.96 TaxID=1182541 RepID=W9Z9E9_9EURO|nr:uncharacterized protein A1O1_04248 [Capronia coronata CBS 617.96]EXJ91139.1 hypothetical protein A1O1_04248 [Capronia coronata CBS 617.96]
MDGFERLRPVGRLERWSTAQHGLKFYFNVALTASYQLPEGCSSPLKHYIYDACRVAVGRHPILSAIPVDEDTNEPHFVRLPKIDLDRCVSFHERQHEALQGPNDAAAGPGSDTNRDTDLDALLTTQHNISFAPPHPFWRLCVLTDAAHPHRLTAAFVFHHALGDGNSAVAFHRTLCQALSEAVSTVSDKTVPTIIPSPSTALLPNVEALHPMPLSISYLLTVLFKEKIWSSRDPGLWTGSKIQLPLVNRVHHLAFSQPSTTSFVNACRANGTTVTAGLQTVIAGALFAHLPDTFTTLNCGAVISTRRWLPPDVIDDDSMGVYFQDCTEDYRRQDFRTEMLPWDEARRSRKTLETVLSLKGKNATPNLLRYVNNYQKEIFLPKISKDRDSSYEVSNLGVVKGTKGKEEGGSGVEMGRMVFTQSAVVTGRAIEVSVVTGQDGCLVLGFTWQKGVVEDTLMEQVISGVEEEVQRLAQV